MRGVPFPSPLTTCPRRKTKVECIHSRVPDPPDLNDEFPQPQALDNIGADGSVQEDSGLTSSASAPQRESEHRAGSEWHSPLHLCHSASAPAGHPHLMSEIPAPDRLESRSLPPRRRTGRAEKWHKVAGSGAFSEHPYTVDGRVRDGDRLGSSFGMSHRTGIGKSTGKREGPGRATMDRPRAPARGSPCPSIPCAYHTSCGRLSFAAGAGKLTDVILGERLKNSEEAQSDGGLGHTRPRRAIPRDHPAEPARHGPVSSGGEPDGLLGWRSCQLPAVLNSPSFVSCTRLPTLDGSIFCSA
jgi:hypothetical protein